MITNRLGDPVAVLVRQLGARAWWVAIFKALQDDRVDGCPIVICHGDVSLIFLALLTVR